MGIKWPVQACAACFVLLLFLPQSAYVRMWRAANAGNDNVARCNVVVALVICFLSDEIARPPSVYMLAHVQ